MGDQINHNMIQKNSYLNGLSFTDLVFANSNRAFKRENPAGNYMLKVNNRSTRTRYEICSKLAIKMAEADTIILHVF